jgi:hypothetical protein
MTSTPPTHRTPARWRAKAAVIAATAIAAAGAATIPAATASAAPATAVLAGPTVREQQALNQDIAIAADHVHTTAISSPVPTPPARYHYQTITVPGYPSVYLNGISDFGGYAGEACKDRNCTTVKLFTATPAGTITFYTLPFANYHPAGPFNTTATGMDNAGAVVGAYTGTGGTLHGFLRTATGALTQINDPRAGAGGTVADGISPNGTVITGFYTSTTGTMHGFLLHHGAFTTYDVPGAAGTVVGFDNHSEFGGTYYTASGASRGFYEIGGHLHTLKPPTEPGARHPALILSDADTAGTLFGYVDLANLPGYGFAYAHGRFTTFRDPHQAGTGPQAGTVIYSANSDGVVAGAYTYTKGTAKQLPYAHGFIAWPDRSAHRARAAQREVTELVGGHNRDSIQAAPAALGVLYRYT